MFECGQYGMGLGIHWFLLGYEEGPHAACRPRNGWVGSGAGLGLFGAEN